MGSIMKHICYPALEYHYYSARGWTIRFGGGTYIQSPGFEKLIEPDNIFNVSKFNNVNTLQSEQSQQVVIGITKNIGKSWQIEVEGYVKNIKT